MTADHHCSKMKCVLTVVIIAIAGLQVTTACDPAGLGVCQEKTMKQALSIEGDDKTQICKLLDNMKECMMVEARCPEESMKEAFELIKPGLKKRLDIDCGACGATAASAALVCLASLVCLLRQ